MKHELSSMKAFVILAESSSFNNAAKLLNITQPALTRRIKKRWRKIYIFNYLSVQLARLR
ncbi:LysR family transcriptional regulator [Escherichia coli]|nr:LysR family transcriptional regulator [Escherichia coli]